MNERIKELAKQVDACYIPRYDMWQMDTETLQKFAELIVRECADLHFRGIDEISVETEYKIRGIIKDHFGVEE